MKNMNSDTCSIIGKWLCQYLSVFAFSLLATLLLCGCTTNVKKQSVSLSDVFELKQFSGGFGQWAWKRDDIYVHHENGKLEYIGSVESGASGFVRSFGFEHLEHRVVALSEDGRSVVFDHWALHAPSFASLENGIYSYRYGKKTEKVVTTKATNTAMWTRWPKVLPANILPFMYSPDSFGPDDIVWAIRADDNAIFPLAMLDASPMHRCAFDGNTSLCKQLLEQGGDIDARTYWGFTPLDLAIIRDHEGMAIYLLENGASPTGGIYPAFHNAVELVRMDVIKAMLAQKVDVNRQDQCGNTPLHLAVIAGRRKCGEINRFFPWVATTGLIMGKNMTTPLVQLLLEFGANPSIRNKSGKLPREEIYKYTPEATKKILENYRE